MLFRLMSQRQWGDLRTHLLYLDYLSNPFKSHLPLRTVAIRFASSSSMRWQSRQAKDKYAIQAKVQGLKSRAAYKLLEVCSAINADCHMST